MWRSYALVATIASLLLVAAGPARAALVYQRLSNDRLIAARDDGSHARVIARPREPVAEVAVSPNGRWAAFLTTGTPISEQNAASIYVVDLRGGRPRLLLNRDVSLVLAYPSVAWSPDSRHLIVGDENAFKAIVLDPANGAHFALRLDEGSFAGASFSPNGRRVAVGSAPVSPTAEEVLLFETRPGGELGSAGEGLAPDWGPRGFAYVDQDGLEFARHVGGAARLLLRATGAFPYPRQWSSNGRRLLATAGAVPYLEAHVLSPAENRDIALPQTFAEVDALSRDGHHVLGVVGRNVVSVGLGGKVRILVRNARSASWNQ